MRGKGYNLNDFKTYSRITPRLCGEKLAKPFPAKSFLGSPPPMRGKGLNADGDTFEAGITPAYAGKSALGAASKSVGQDHPRLCGEKELSSVALSPNKGSPPPMRGKAPFDRGQGRRSRITPAYAGKSCVHVIFCTFFRDHPRLCGEKFK